MGQLHWLILRQADRQALLYYTLIHLMWQQRCLWYCASCWCCSKTAQLMFQDHHFNLNWVKEQRLFCLFCQITQLWHFKNVMSQLHHRHVTSNNRRVCQRLADCFKNQPLEKHKQSPQTPEWEDECCQGGNCEEKWAGQLVCLKKTCHKVTLSIICSVVYCFFFHNTLC